MMATMLANMFANCLPRKCLGGILKVEFVKSVKCVKDLPTKVHQRLEKIGFDTAENEPSKVCYKSLASYN